MSFTMGDTTAAIVWYVRPDLLPEFITFADIPL
jgi:hypothetical protein